MEDHVSPSSVPLQPHSKRNKKVPVDLVALTCDTTGTLIASAYVNPKTKIAVIFGTGCNAAYMETVKEIPKLKDHGFASDAEIAINCEWVRSSPIFSNLHG